MEDNIVWKEENTSIFSFSHNGFKKLPLEEVYINPWPNDKFLEWSKLKAFADYKINIT